MKVGGAIVLNLVSEIAIVMIKGDAVSLFEKQ